MEIHRFSVGDKILALDVPTSLCVELDDVGNAVLARLALGDTAEQVQRSLSADQPAPDVRATLSEFAAARRRGVVSFRDRTIVAAAMVRRQRAGGRHGRAIRLDQDPRLDTLASQKD